MKYQGSLQELIQANKKEYSAHCLLNVLSVLGVKTAVHPTLGDVRNFIDFMQEKHFLALLEIYGNRPHD